MQTDFGLKDGAVNEMKAIAISVDAQLDLFDLTHEIPVYNIWEAAYRLEQSASYWPAGTVFVSVVDPGVGTSRRSVVMKSRSGHFFVTPDNGTLHFVAQSLGIAGLRLIDETTNRRKGSGGSYTFHGRDVYAYTAAKLAAGKISFEDVGPRLQDSVTRFKVFPPTISRGVVSGNIPVLDPQFGNVWTNIPDSLIKQIGVVAGDSLIIHIMKGDSLFYSGSMQLANTFGDVPRGSSLGYINSLMNFALAINEGSFADSFHIKSGPEWKVSISR